MAKEAVKRSRLVKSAPPGVVVSLKPTNDELQLDLKRASNVKYLFKKDIEVKFGLKTLVELLEYLADNKTTKHYSILKTVCMISLRPTVFL